MTVLFIRIFSVHRVYSNESVDTNTEIVSMVEEYLKQKTVITGTLDIYDDKIDAVRNLRKNSEFRDVVQDGGLYKIEADYRDIHSGDIIGVEFVAKINEKKLDIQEINLKEIKEPILEQTNDPRDYSDQEIQDFMKKFIEQKSRFTGYYNLYDQENEKLRKLKFLKIEERVRKLGIISISSAEFTDIDSNETLMVDISVENKNGKLNIQAFRIRDIN